VWSTDWVRDHRKQLSRILVAYENAKVAPRNPSSEPPTHTPARAIRSTPPSANAPRRVEPIPLFSSIDQVTSETIDDAVKQLLNENGSTPEADLIKAVARRLGFNRTGSKISNRIEQRLRQLLRKNRIQLDEDGLLFDMPDPSDQR
jgi:hypothetical protein